MGVKFKFYCVQGKTLSWLCEWRCQALVSVHGALNVTVEYDMKSEYPCCQGSIQNFQQTIQNFPKMQEIGEGAPSPSP